MKCFTLIIYALSSVTIHAHKVSSDDGKSFSMKRFGYYSAGSPAEWKSMSIYNVYPKSFKDNNGDGVGDINGIRQNLQHIADLGFDYVWLNPMYPSPNRDNGYDISNYTNIDPTYGTMNDFDNLMLEMKKLGLKFMMDFVLNHCSSEHVWFQKSKEGIDPYKDYFIWRDPKGYDQNGKPIPPNNWLCVYGATAWTWVESRKQFYYHVFTDGQPELNLRNPLVIEELKNVLRFWLDKGVTGIRLDAVPVLFEDDQFRDEPYKTEEAEQRKSESHQDLNHIYTWDLHENYELCGDIRRFVEEEYTSKDGIDRIFIAEVYTTTELTVKWFNYIHLVFSFQLAALPYSANASQLNECIRDLLQNMPAGAVATWNTDNHDINRKGTIWGEESIDIFNILLTLLPGNLCLYYGQEIGMTNHVIRPDQVRDKTRYFTLRDQGRTPMQWDDTLNAGFSSNHKPWLPVNPNYWRINVKNEKSLPLGHYNIFKKLMNLRKTPAVRCGQFSSYIHSEWVYIFTRNHGNQSYVVILNIGTESEIIDFSIVPSLPDSLSVLIPTINSGYKIGDVVSIKPELKSTTILRPKSGLVLTTTVSREEKSPTDGPGLTSSSEASEVPNMFILILLVFFCCIR